MQPLSMALRGQRERPNEGLVEHRSGRHATSTPKTILYLNAGSMLLAADLT